MEQVLNFMEAGAELLLTTPFALPLIVLSFAGGMWVLAVVLTKAQEAE